MEADAPELLWQPDPVAVERSRMAAFRRWLLAERGLDVAGYQIGRASCRERVWIPV